MKVDHFLFLSTLCVVYLHVTGGMYHTTIIPWFTTKTPTPSYLNCYLSSNTCLNGGTCRYSTIYYGYYFCACPYGYTGKRCETSVITTTTITPTVSDSIAPTVSDSIGIGIQCGNKICYNNATCYKYSYSTTTRCNCRSEYTGTYCERKKCNTKTNLCLNGGRCSFGRCYCKNTYWYKGYNCEKVSDCNPHNYSLNCRNNGYCKLGKCECTLGYDGAFCEYCKKCSANHTCLNGGTCYKGVCYCPYGYSGRFCDIVITTTPPICQCKFGNCMPDPKNHNMPKCFCFEGYTGRNCETELSDVKYESKWCTPINPCHNSAKCIGDDFDYDCKCDSKKYYGSHCERQHVSCGYGSTCQNGGTCKRYRYGNSLKYVYYGQCVCKPGYKGDFCQKEIDSYPHWVEVFSENQRWSGNYSYNKFLIPFQLEIDAVTKGLVIATFIDRDTKLEMKGYSLDDIYVTFNLTKLIKPSHRIPSDIELTGQFMKQSKRNKWMYKGKVSRPDNAIFGTFTLAPSKEKAGSLHKQVAIAIGVGTTVSVLVVVAVIFLVIILVRKGVLRRESNQFSPTRFSNSEQSVNTIGK